MDRIFNSKGLSFWRPILVALLVSFFSGSTASCNEIQGTSLRGPRIYHPFTLRLPGNPGDTLPPGKGVQFLIGIFDTGSRFFVINNLPYALEDNGRITKILPSAADILDICGHTPPPVNETPTCPPPRGNPPRIEALSPLDVRVWGMDAFVQGQGVRIDHPEAEVRHVMVRPDDFRPDFFAGALVGAPVASRIIAHIDYARVVQRQLFGRKLKTPYCRFWNHRSAATPHPLFETGLIPNPSSFPGPSRRDQASQGIVYQVKGVRFINKGIVVSQGDFVRLNYSGGVSPAAGNETVLRVHALLDTGTTTTQITLALAAALGINPHDMNQRAKASKFRTKSAGGHITELDCYVIDRVEFPSVNATYKYVINDPYVCVNPMASNQSFLGKSQAIIGSNYFEQTAILFDGPRMRLGFFSGIREK